MIENLRRLKSNTNIRLFKYKMYSKVSRPFHWKQKSVPFEIVVYSATISCKRRFNRFCLFVFFMN